MKCNKIYQGNVLVNKSVLRYFLKVRIEPIACRLSGGDFQRLGQQFLNFYVFFNFFFYNQQLTI